MTRCASTQLAVRADGRASLVGVWGDVRCIGLALAFVALLNGVVGRAAESIVPSVAISVSRPRPSEEQVHWHVDHHGDSGRMRLLRASPGMDGGQAAPQPVAEMNLAEATAGCLNVALGPSDRSAYLAELVDGRGSVTLHGPFSASAAEPGAILFNVPAKVSRRARPAGPIGPGDLRAGVPIVNVRQNAGALGILTADAIAGVTGIPRTNVVAWLSEGRLRLEHEGKPLAALRRDAPSGLVFRAPDTASIYSRQPVLQLVVGPATAMRAQDGTPTAGVPIEVGLTALRFEEDWIAVTTAPGAAFDDVWFWESLSAAAPALARKTHAFSVDDLATLPGRTSIELEVVSTSVAHHVLDVALNGTVIGSDEWSGGERRRVTTAVPPALLLPGTNVLVLTNRGDRTSTVHVDAFTARHPKRLMAREGRCEWIAVASGPTVVDGFPDAAIEAWDVTDDCDPARLSGVSIGPGTAGTRVLHQAVSGRRYVAFVAGMQSSVGDVSVAEWADLGGKTHRADCVAIAPRQLIDGAEAYARLRNESGLVTVAVSLESVRDEFAGGELTPLAIRRFLAATRNWELAPRYAVILGDGTYDYRGNLGFTDNLVPPAMVLTGFGRYPSDISLGDLDSDGVPEVVVGRLPVKTAGELDAVLAKLRRREVAGRIGGRKAVLAADVPGDAGDFIQDSEALRSIFAAGFPVETIYNRDNVLEPVRAAVAQAFGEGPALFNYAGHGARDRFGNGYLVSTDIAGLPAVALPPLVVAMTCGAGQFGVPGFDCLGETLMLRGDGGAAAVWSPSGFSLNAGAHVLNRAFAEVAVGSVKGDRLGDLIRRAMGLFRARGGDALLGSIYNLIGDPGTPVQWVDSGPAELVVTIRHGDGGVGAEVEWTGGVAPYVVQRRAAAEGSVWGTVATTYEHRWHLPADDGAFLVRVISDQR